MKEVLFWKIKLFAFGLYLLVHWICTLWKTWAHIFLLLSARPADDSRHDTFALLWKPSVSDPLCFCGRLMSPSLSVWRVLTETLCVFVSFSRTHRRTRSLTMETHRTCCVILVSVQAVREGMNVCRQMCENFVTEIKLKIKPNKTSQTWKITFKQAFS